MNQPEDNLNPTRLLFMGEAALTDGFKLIGFETWADPTPDMMERQLEALINQREKAFIILGHALADSDSPLLKRIRAEGGRIIITQVPPLADPENFQCEIDDRLQLLLGGQTQTGQE